MQEFYAVKLKMSASYDVYCCSKQTPESIEKKKKKKESFSVVLVVRQCFLILP